MGVRFPFCEFLLLLMFTMVNGCFSPVQAQDSIVKPSLSTNKTDSTLGVGPLEAPTADEPVVKPKRRLVAALLCVALGPFGMHRLYLGTRPHVAAAYTLTLGGGLGLVPVIDLLHIVFDPDLNKYKNNNKFIMWLK